MNELLLATALYFETDCQKYLVTANPRVLEMELSDDLIQYRLITKARLYLYDHPADRVMLRLIEHEMVTREMILK